MAEGIVKKAIQYLNDIGMFQMIPDETFIKRKYKKCFGVEIDLEHPKTFNEKLQWLKLNDRKEIYITMVDKYEAKKYVAGVIGEEYVIPTLGVWNHYSEIDFNQLPNQFVLKCTHDSGGIYVCNDKSQMNNAKIKSRFQLILKRNYYYRNREWPYKNIQPRIIAEKYMGSNLNDYKLFCFHGKPQIALVCSNRKSLEGLNEDFFDMEWNHLELRRPKHPNAMHEIEKPKNLEKMIELATELAKGTYFMRVDFYEIDQKIYFGELTLYPAGGFEKFEPEGWDEKLGNMIQL